MATLTMVNGTNVLMDKFNSLGEFIDYANSNSHKLQSENGEASNCMTASYAEAHALAVNGWHEVRAEVEAMLDKLTEQIADRFAIISSLEFATSGGAVDVGRWLTGEPECMYSFTPTPSARMGKVVKLFIDYGASANFSAEFIRQRGIVILALVDTLTKMGIACEVWGETAVTYGKGTHTTVVKMHDATSQLDIDGLMFALANPSMLRRLTFSVRELADKALPPSYGRTRHMMFAKDYGADIRIERLESSYDTMMTDPVKWVMSQVEGMELVA